MADFPQHSADLAHAIRKGGLTEAETILDLMGRDNCRLDGEQIAKGRARADRELGRIKPLPRLAQPELLTAAEQAAA